jgi:Protein of unknown function (DUF3667).
MNVPLVTPSFKGITVHVAVSSARIGRYSFKTAFLLFLDVWGMGNRGMFRTLRDLLLRPGYMIRDYLSGMQMAYFPPFKMLFLLTALSLIVAHGVNIKGKTMEDQQQEILSSVHQTQGERADVVNGLANNYVNWIFEIQERFPNSFTLLTVLLLTSFYYIFFRKAKTVDHLRFSEFLIAMIYVVNMLTIYETVFTFFGASTTVITCLSVLTVIPLKQLSGFSWLRTILSMVAAFILLWLVIFVVGSLTVGVLYATGILPK